MESLPNIGADIILEFQQSVNNIKMFGEAMETLDARFGSIERRVDGLRSSLSTLNAQTSRGTGSSLVANMEREINNLIDANGVVLQRVGAAPIKINASTINNLMAEVNRKINEKLANSYRNIVIDVDPNMQVGKIPIGDDDLKAVNQAIARLVRVQLNNLVNALRQHGAGMVSPQDLASLQFHIGKDTIRQILAKVKTHLLTVLNNPQIGDGAALVISDSDVNKITRAIKGRIKETINTTALAVGQEKEPIDVTNDMRKVYANIDNAVKRYVSGVSTGINTSSAEILNRPLNDVSTSLRRFMAKELGTDLDNFNRMFENHQFSARDVQTAELRRQFASVERALNRKLNTGLNREVRELVKQIDMVQISYHPRLGNFLVREINRINNEIVKKIREQIDLQFMNMRAEINSIRTAPKDINRSRRIRDLGHVDTPMVASSSGSERQRTPLINDPYARRDGHFNSFGLEGAITNTFRHILAGSMVGAPMMLMYQSFEQYRVSQLEQLKMFSNFFAKATSETTQRAEMGDTRTAAQVSQETVRNIMPFVKDTAQFFAIDYGTMAEVASVGSRLLETEAQVRTFTDVVGKIYNIDREGDPSANVAPGLEAFMGQFGLMVHELESQVALPLAVATNVTNATTEGILNAIMRSGSAFNTSGITPEQAIAMVASSIKFTGLSGENIGNFYKSVLPRLQSPTALAELEKIGINVYEPSENGSRMARSASDIFSDVSEKYATLDDKASRDIIMRMFGTYQSSKGTVTLMEFEQVKEIMEAIKDFSQEDFNSLMQNNSQAPILEIQRAGVSMQLALVDVMEELTPEIVAISKAITELSSGIREHKEALGGFISFLGTALLGYGSMYIGRRMSNSATVNGAMGRVSVLDNLSGNSGIFGRGRTEGLLAKEFGSFAAPGVLDNTRRTLGKALDNQTLNPVVNNLSRMTDEQIRSTQAYLRDNNIRVKSMTDLMLAVQMSGDHQAKPVMTDQQKWGAMQRNTRNLFRNDMTGLDQAFASNLAADMQDKKRFDELGKSKQGIRVTNFLSGMSENDMKRFQTHLDEIHKQTGRTVDSMGRMAYAIDTYTGAQVKNRQEVIRTNPQLAELSRNMDKVSASMSSANMRTGMRNMDTFLGSISTKARGAISALGGLARTVGGFAVGTAMAAGIGWTISGVANTVQRRTEDEEIVQRTEKQLQDIQAYRDYANTGTGGQLMSSVWNSLKGLVDVEFLFGDRLTDLNDMKDVRTDFMKFLSDNEGLNLEGMSDGRRDARIREFLEGLDKEQQDDLWQRYTTNEGSQKLLQEASTRLYVEELKKRSEQSMELAAIEEGVTLEEAKRRRREMEKGTYRSFDFDTIQQDINTRIQEYTTKYSLAQIDTMAQGYSTDSTKMVAINREMSEVIANLYQEQLDGIAQTIKDITEDLERARREGAPQEDITRLTDEVNRWTNIQENEGERIRLQQEEVKKAQRQLEFDTSLSRMNREFNSRDTMITLQDTINSLSMDRNSKEYSEASIQTARERITSMNKQISELSSVSADPDQQIQLDAQIDQLRVAVEQERVKIRDLRLTSVSLFKQDLQDQLAELSNEYLQAQVDSGGMDESSPFMRQLRVGQYERQVSLFDSVISDLRTRLEASTDSEEQKTLQREIRDLQRQSLQAQIGILDEMKNTGGSFNLPDNVKAMSYYEYITKDNTHSSYTVQGGDTHITISMPNVTEAPSADRARQIGKALGEGYNNGRTLRQQKMANPFGYRG